MTAPVIGIDFGTSNTAAAVLERGRPRIITLEPEQETLPTAIFLDYASRHTYYGRDAVSALIDGRDGRFMRALKSVLGTPLARERRTFLNERLTLLDVVARFLAEVRARASADLGAEVRSVVAGRPVHFHSADAGRDAQAAADLAECYAMAGFETVRFLAEPEAAALAAGATDGLSLIVDIGGGTSDFTLFRSNGGKMKILASHGVRIGGTDFDKALSLAHVMPLLGMGGELRNLLGKGRNSVPPSLYLDLASWEKIVFVYGADSLRDARQMLKLAVDPYRMQRLVTVLEMHLGHDLAFMVEAAKITANGSGMGEINLSVIEPGLQPPLSEADLMTGLWPMVERIGQAASDTAEMAGVAEDAVDRVVFVGGSSLIGVLDRLMRVRFQNAGFEYSEVFTAVVDGLALATAEG
jgi:hypothetical chaperone protein